MIWLKTPNRIIVFLSAVTLLIMVFSALNISQLTCYSNSKIIPQKTKRDGDSSSSTVADQVEGYHFEKNDVKQFKFDKWGKDVLVFLHIQKTGGTKFSLDLVQNLDFNPPCKCKLMPRPNSPILQCNCKSLNSSKIWLFESNSVSWKPCGMHWDWTELHDDDCVANYVKKRNGENTRLLYLTFLREPLSRILSELRCHQEGITWERRSVHKCNRRLPTKEELPPCYEGIPYSNITLDVFLGCKSNLALNRQARMLADLTLVNCYNYSRVMPRQRELIILNSAIKNLRSMAYFGLTEYQRESQYLFEKTFGMKFIHPFKQRSLNWTRAGIAKQQGISPRDVNKITKLNNADVQLYEYAKKLFFYRVRYFQDEDSRNNS